MKLQVFHETSYRYEQPVRRSIQMLRMTPAKTHRQNVLNWQLDLPGKATPWTDAYGNLCHCLVLENASQDIVLRARGSVDLIESDQGEPEGPVPHAVYLRATMLTRVDASIQNFIEPFRSSVKSRPYMALHDVLAFLVFRRATSAVIYIRQKTSKSLAMHGPRPGWADVGLAMTSATRVMQIEATLDWRMAWTMKVPVRCAECALAAAMRPCTALQK